MENKNIEAMGEIAKAYADPFAAMKDSDGAFRFMGALNQLVYGINPYEKKAEFAPAIEPGEREDDEQIDGEKLQATYPPDDPKDDEKMANGQY